MTAAVSQLCVWQGSTLWTVSSSTKAVKVEQVSPLFHLYLYLFFKSEEHPFFANLACQVLHRDIYTETAVGLLLTRRSRPFRFRRCF